MVDGLLVTTWFMACIDRWVVSEISLYEGLAEGWDKLN